jgi:hypothetical protein
MLRLSHQRYYKDLESTTKAVSTFQKGRNNNRRSSTTQMYLLMLDMASLGGMSHLDLSLATLSSRDLFLFFLLIPTCPCCSSTFFILLLRKGREGVERNGIRGKKETRSFSFASAQNKQEKKTEIPTRIG